MSNSLKCQPPLGGCVLKLFYGIKNNPTKIQPPLGGCALKQRRRD